MCGHLSSRREGVERKHGRAYNTCKAAMAAGMGVRRRAAFDVGDENFFETEGDEMSQRASKEAEVCGCRQRRNPGENRSREQ